MVTEDQYGDLIQLRAEIDEFQSEGWDVSRLERVLEEDPKNAWEVFSSYVADVEKLAILGRKYHDLDRRFFDKDAWSLEKRLTNPDDVKSLERDIYRLKSRIDEKMEGFRNAREELESLEKNGYTVIAYRAQIESSPKQAYDTLVDLSKRVEQLDLIRSELESMNTTGHDDRVRQIMDNIRNPARLDRVVDDFDDFKRLLMSRGPGSEKSDNDGMMLEEMLAQGKALMTEGKSIEAHGLYEVILESFPDNREARFFWRKTLPEGIDEQLPPIRAAAEQSKSTRQETVEPVRRSVHRTVEEYIPDTIPDDENVPDEYLVDMPHRERLFTSPTPVQRSTVTPVHPRKPSTGQPFRSSRSCPYELCDDDEGSLAVYEMGPDEMDTETAVSQQIYVADGSRDRMDMHVEGSGGQNGPWAQDPRYLEFLGIEAYHQGDMEGAIRYFKAIIKIDHRYVNTYTNIGVIRKQQGRYKEAFYFFDKAVRIDPKFTGAWFNKGIVQMMLDDHCGAMDSLFRALKLNPKHQEAKTYMKACLDHCKEHDRKTYLTWRTRLRNDLKIVRSGS